MKVALVCDFLTQFGGAERVLLALKEIYQAAPIYTALYNSKNLPKIFKDFDIRTSYLQKWPFLNRDDNFVLPFVPSAFENFDLSDFDLVIASGQAFSKGVLTRPDCPLIYYCHSPMGYLWHYFHFVLNQFKLKGILSLPFQLIVHYLRIWDQVSAKKVDYFIANSKNTQNRILKYYRRDSEIIYPPAETKRLAISDKRLGKYFVIVSRLSAYKRIDLAVLAFNKLKLPLWIIGCGKERKKLEKIAKNNIKFFGFVSDKELPKYYQNAQAFILPFEEDFGITPVEAMASGTPVIAYKKGGVLESVIENKTGVFFEKLTAESLLDGIKRFMKIENQFNPKEIRKQAEKFDKKIFQKKIKEFVEKVMRENK